MAASSALAGVLALTGNLNAPRVTWHGFGRWWAENHERLATLDVEAACREAFHAPATRRTTDGAAWRDDRLTQIRELLARGATQRAIADRFNISPGRVWQILRDAGCPPRLDPLTPCAAGCGVRTRAEFCSKCQRQNRTRSVNATSMHGAYETYRRGCRCECCRAANTQQRRSRAEALVRRLGGPPSHDNNGYSNYGCRCDVCRTAHAEYERERRVRK